MRIGFLRLAPLRTRLRLVLGWSLRPSSPPQPDRRRPCRRLLLFEALRFTTDDLREDLSETDELHERLVRGLVCAATVRSERIEGRSDAVGYILREEDADHLTVLPHDGEPRAPARCF